MIEDVCDLFSFSESEETVSCKWDDSAADMVQLIECKSYKGKEPSLCFVVSLLPLTAFSSCLYSVIMLCVSERWMVIKANVQQIDTLDQWC